MQRVILDWIPDSQFPEGEDSTVDMEKTDFFWGNKLEPLSGHDYYS